MFSAKTIIQKNNGMTIIPKDININGVRTNKKYISCLNLNHENSRNLQTSTYLSNLACCKDTKSLYHFFMYSLVSLLSGIYPLPAMHLLGNFYGLYFNHHYTITCSYYIMAEW